MSGILSWCIEGLKEFSIPFTEPHSGKSRYFEGICLTKQAQRKLDNELCRDDILEYEDDDELEDAE